ncbi:uncharacterized protein (DUF885 family) [Kordia periserrulae]|uniref:Uncharacterized protein (DUF885 family) n=1 Tax=Kordia periserrulae TaxID=701523 RepID=A0A2T6C588_9FLAO|nr:DUF885 domain-containing protein [Kordia periserrulae]PTX63447.1 uncharacterized protein (DUF885 family) [Kordia periserrulae]
MKKIVLLLAFLTLISCGSDEKKEIPKSEFSFAGVLEAYHDQSLALNPINATAAGDTRYNDQFPNFLSDEYQDKLKAHYHKFRDTLQNFDDTNLTESEQMSKDILYWECDMNLRGLSFQNSRLLPIDQMWSINLVVGQFASGTSAQPFNTEEDYENWLKRLEGFNTWLQTAKTNMQEGIEEGFVLPKSLIKKVIPQFEVLATTPLNTHLFYAPINNFPADFTSEAKDKLTKAYTTFLTETLVPSFNEMYQFLKTDYLNAGRESSGIADTPYGDAYYEYSIKKYTTTDMTADEIHELGLQEVARILSEMEKVKQQVGFKGDIKSFFNDVRKNKNLMPYSEPQQIIDNFNAIHDKMQPQINQLFDVKPKTPFEVRRTEAFREASASAEYNPGSLDGTRPGIFYVPIPDAASYNVFSDEALFLHEAIPGHHYQISLTQENEALPDFRKTLWYSAYGEGWALYTESLGKELGLYTDPYQYFGMLSAEMHRAIRLVVDTGLHAKGWTREQAIQYSLDNEAESEASIIAEIERYMAMPGQALSYKIGQLKIRELRTKAEKELGENFDIKQFHNQVLETGCVPLQLLEDKINAWIEMKKK